MPNYSDPNDDGNSSKYHTGMKCIENGCNRPAGTAWSPHWCFECNVIRMDRINENLKKMQQTFCVRTEENK